MEEPDDKKRFVDGDGPLVIGMVILLVFISVVFMFATKHDRTQMEIKRQMQNVQSQ